MAEVHIQRIGELDAGMRLDTYLASLDRTPSRSLCAKLIAEGNVKVDGAVVTDKSWVVQEGSIIEHACFLEDSPIIVPDNIPLDVVFEDDYLLVISKPAGLVCHPSRGHARGTLANALVAHCGIERLATIQGDDRPGIVHRLDQDTSGLMLAAKTNPVAEALQDAIRIRAVDRRYVALVHGLIAPDTGLIDAPIRRSKRERVRMAVSHEPDARQAVTTFTVLERFAAQDGHGDYTLVECKLYTGRTHQIRVHMDYIRHPCVGDQLYSSLRNIDDLGLTRQFLHSYRLGFTHPVSGEHYDMQDRLPEELRDVLECLEQSSIGRTAIGEEVVAFMQGMRDDLPPIED